MKRERNLSDFWRLDRSADEAAELVSVLQGADLLIGNMGSDIRVVWSGGGVSYTDFENSIVALDYGPLMGRERPFSGTAVDEVIGYAAHEGGHCLWSLPGRDQTIERELRARWSSLPQALQQDYLADEPTVLAELCRIQNILEDAFIDRRVVQQWPVLGEYIKIARNKLKERTPLDLDAIASAPSPDHNSVINLWTNLCLYGSSPPEDMSERVRLAVASLLKLTQQAVAEPDVVARQALAVEAAAILWRDFTVREAPVPTAPSAGGMGPSRLQSGRDTGTGGDGGQVPTKSGCDPDLVGVPQGGGAHAGAGGNLDDFDPAPGPGLGGRRVVPVPREILEQVVSAVGGGEQDLSQSVARALAEEAWVVAAKAKCAGHDGELAERVVSKVRREIREIRQAFQQQDGPRRWRHGLDRGRVDGSRLWRSCVGDPNYYQRREAPGTPSVAVGLLLDLSGSMTQYLPIIQQTAALFAEGLLRMPGIDFAAWCYTGKQARVSLTRICDRQLPRLCLGNLPQGGGTPSGAAIVAAEVLMERMTGKGKLLIHFSDGRPDNASHVIKAVQACREAHIQVYAIGLPEHSQMLAHQYGERHYQTVQMIGELPRAVARIVKQLAVPQHGETPSSPFFSPLPWGGGRRT